MSRIGWLDCASGASGDMLLGALVAAGVPLDVLTHAVDAVAPEKIRLRPESVVRNGLAATLVHVEGTDSTHHRTWADVRSLLDAAGLPEQVSRSAHATFEALAHAEARVHDTTPESIHFHEVGALDAIADVVGVCAGLAHLGLDRLVVSPVAVGSGFVRAAHGRLPVPVPAVVELLAAAGAPSYAGEIDGTPVGELCTPTGAALLVAHATAYGPQPPMRVAAQGFGAGTRETPGRANAVRLLVGEPAPEVWTAGSAGAAASPGESTQLVVESNVDDLDPRVWPAVLTQLLEAGAADAWLTPILMKKGRPAHTLAVLVDPDRYDAVCEVVFTQTSAIGVRSHTVRKRPLEREFRILELPGGTVRLKVATYAGQVVNAQPEYDDVLALAELTGRPVKTVLAQAAAAAQEHL
ncbi:nickel pincer cofactor biosynthesis protein LarC [Actinopolymorpha sp. NPDC004070]|uniref:nickel pincer cofactor biosynthesis protein LarC n=1 Tax=Actinopolymorpha sp. NPDC004070 TaxID=3154548 RepID=UPI0033B24AAE